MCGVAEYPAITLGFGLSLQGAFLSSCRSQPAPTDLHLFSVLCGGDAGSDELPPHKSISGGRVDETPHCAAMDPVWIAWSMCCHGSCADSLERNTIYPFSMSVAVYYPRSVMLNALLVPWLRRCLCFLFSLVTFSSLEGNRVHLLETHRLCSKE